jgi:hypothetical protein
LEHLQFVDTLGGKGRQDVELGSLSVEKRGLDAERVIRQQLVSHLDSSADLDPDQDVILYPSGMAAIYETILVIEAMQHVPQTCPIATYGFGPFSPRLVAEILLIVLPGSCTSTPSKFSPRLKASVPSSTPAAVSKSSMIWKPA